VFAALAIAAQRVQSAQALAASDCFHGEPTDVVAIDFGQREAHLILGLASDQIQYDIQKDRVTIRSRGGSAVMIFSLDESGSCANQIERES